MKRNKLEHYTKGNTCPDCGITIMNTSKKCRSCSKKGHHVSVETRNKIAQTLELKGKDGHMKSRYDGRVKVYKPRHPMSNKEGYVYRSRLMMSNKLDRLLLDDEHVHHINEDKSDDRPENLEIFDSNSSHIKHHRRSVSDEQA